MRNFVRNLSLSDLHILGYLVFKNAPARFLPKSHLVRASLERAGMKISFYVYISSMLFWSLVVSAVASCISTLAGLPSQLSLELPLLSEPLSFEQPTLGLLVGSLAGAVTIGVFGGYPRYVSGRIRREIEKNLVYITNHMAIMSSGGATSEEMFASLADVGEVYGISESAGSVMRSLEILGSDIIEAIGEESRRTPSREYGDFLQGFIATVREGGDVKSYIGSMTEKYINDRRRLLGKIISNLDLAAELYTVVLVAFPIIMIVLLAVMGFFGGEVLGNLTPGQVMNILTYVLVPFSAAGILILIDSLLGGW